MGVVSVSRHDYFVVTTTLQWEFEVCRDRVFFLTTGFGCLVSRQGQSCGRWRDRAPAHSDKAPIRSDNGRDRDQQHAQHA